MTVHFLKGASARQLEEIQQQNNLGDDAGLKCFDIWILCIDFPHHLACFYFLWKAVGNTQEWSGYEKIL